jgi:hypothetical protein
MRALADDLERQAVKIRELLLSDKIAPQPMAAARVLLRLGEMGAELKNIADDLQRTRRA